MRRIQELVRELRRERGERSRARRRIEQLEEENRRLHEQMERLEEENKRLRKELETAQRAARRQAAPFSRGQPKSHPKNPGRKPGAAHGPHHHRPIPDHVDEQIPVAAPAQFPDCGGPLTVERVESQYQEEVVRRTWVRRFHIPICRCAQCAKRVQGRHPLQTSDALGAAAVQVGPEAVTLGVLMNKSLGLPHADAAAILKYGLWIDPEPGRDLPGDSAGGAESGSHLARFAGCGTAQCTGAYGRNRLEGGSAVALAMGGGHRTGDLL